MSNTKTWILAGILSILLPAALPAQETPLDEMALGLRHRHGILSRYLAMTPGDADAVARRAFDLLRNTPTCKAGPALPYQMTLIQEPTANAFTTPGGQVYVHSGMIPVLGDEVGVWAAILSHEIGHSVAQHHYRRYLRQWELMQLKRQLQYRAAMGDKTAGWALLGVRVGGDLMDLKLSRDEELEADRLGLQMMAEAGVHPDHALTLYRRMKDTGGDQSRIAAFFTSGHPRWQTREVKALPAIESALSAFERQWSGALGSPGGVPPSFVQVGTPAVKPDKKNKTTQIQIPWQVRNAQGSELTIQLRLLSKGKPAPSSIGGALSFENKHRLATARHSGTLDVTIPASLNASRQKHLDAEIELRLNGELVESASTRHLPVFRP